MFIDFLPLLLINMVVGLVLLASYLATAPDAGRGRAWAPGFLMVGVIAAVFGGAITLRWPLPGAFNIAFGETSVLFGIVFLGAGAALAAGWSLFSVALYAAFAGLAGVVLGLRIFSLHLTQQPLPAALGFLLTGLCGIFAWPMLRWGFDRRPIRYLGALVALGAAVIWALTGYLSYWSHLQGFAGYMPK